MKWVLKQAEMGDMVRVKLGRIYHYGIFVSEDEIIQFGLAPSLSSLQKDSEIEVCASDVDVFLAGGFLEVAEFDRAERRKNRSAKETVKIARSRIGERGYNIIYNNCEHFAYECVTGKKYCSQTEEVRNVFKSLPMLNFYAAVIPKEISVGEIEPKEKKREIGAIKDDLEQRRQYFAWKLLEYALQHSFCYKIKNLTLKNGEWVCEKCKFDICIENGVVAVAISRKDVQIKMLSQEDASVGENDSRIETLTLGDKQYSFLIRNETVGALKLYPNVEI